MRIKDIPTKDEDLIISVDYTQGKDLTCISMYMTVEKYKELERLAEIGKATELIFDRFEDIITIKYFEKEYEEQEELYVDVDNSPSFNSLEDLLEWYRKEANHD